MASRARALANRYMRTTSRSPFSPSQSLFVIDPRNFSTRLLVTPSSAGILEDTNTRLVRCFVWLKNASERWFSHFFLLIALLIYALIGGFIFSKVEGDFEAEQNGIIRQLHEPIENMSELTVGQLWRLRNRFPMPERMPYNPPQDMRWYRGASTLLDRYESTVLDQCRLRLNYSIDTFSETNHWNYWGSVFFSLTVFTTIGYGDKPPKTTAGKAITVLYAFIGIPLLLMVLADFGKIFTRIIKFLVLWVRRLYYNRNLSSVRRMGREATRAAQIQASIMEALNKVQRQPPFFVNPETGQPTMLPPKPIEQRSSTPRPQVIISPATPRSLSPTTPMPADAMVGFGELDDEFNLPISLALFILMLYLFLGAIIFWASENWTLLHSFYFVFISMSTIGFGDFVPTRIQVLMCAFIYLLFGLALTSMCINVIQEKLSSTFERARLTIGETIGLDPTTPITVQMNELPKKRKNSTNNLTKQVSFEKDPEKSKPGSRPR